MVESLDMFTQDLPGFNIKGRTKVASVCGAVMSLAIIVIMLLYATLKFIHLMSRVNPTINSFTQQNYFDATNIVNF